MPYSHKNLKRDADDVASNFDIPGLEFNHATKALDLEEAGLTRQWLPPNSRFPYGHVHERQEETYVVVRGSGRIALDDEVVDVGEWDAVRVPSGTWRCHESGPDGLELLIFGAPNLGDDPRGDVTGERDWWAGSAS